MYESNQYSPSIFDVKHSAKIGLWCKGALSTNKIVQKCKKFSAVIKHVFVGV